MSNSDDEEALFEDIYGDDEVREEKQEEKETKTEVKNEESNGAEEEAKESTNTDKVKDEVKAEPKNESYQEEKPADVAPLTAPVAAELTTTPVSNATSTSTRKADLSRDAGKMFIGGLDWDTTEDALKEYFSQYGEVIDHTIMRENSTGRSRGFGFLTFADSKSVDEVVKTQHVLDGKVIDPKRAIPRDEQDKTGKIFVGGIAPEVRPHEFEAFFSKFGTIIDAQLMLDKDTGRSRGFGFVTFDSPDAVDKVCQGKYLDFNGRQIEVKRAEPRGPQQQQNHIASQQQRYLQHQGNYTNPVPQSAVPGGYSGVSPEAMTEYFQRMQQYWVQLQQTGIDPAQIAQYTQQMQQFQQMQQQQQSGDVSAPPVTESPTNTFPTNSPLTNAPPDAPRGPRGAGYRGGRGGRGRGRGGYSRNQYHPYQR